MSFHFIDSRLSHFDFLAMENGTNERMMGAGQQQKRLRRINWRMYLRQNRQSHLHSRSATLHQYPKTLSTLSRSRKCAAGNASVLVAHLFFYDRGPAFSTDVRNLI
jgi:hypothetical protein